MYHTQTAQNWAYFGSFPWFIFFSRPLINCEIKQFFEFKLLFHICCKKLSKLKVEEDGDLKISDPLFEGTVHVEGKIVHVFENCTIVHTYLLHNKVGTDFKVLGVNSGLYL